MSDSWIEREQNRPEEDKKLQLSYVIRKNRSIFTDFIKNSNRFSRVHSVTELSCEIYFQLIRSGFLRLSELNHKLSQLDP